MNTPLKLAEIHIRTQLEPGDIGYIAYLHGHWYAKEYDYGISFETYVAQGLNEFYNQYNSSRSRVWIAEHQEKIVGFLLLMDRGEAAQLRYFLILPDYRGMGLGKALMQHFMDFYQDCDYRHAYLWTTHELSAAAALYTRHGFRLTEEKPSTAFGKELLEQRYDLHSMNHQ